MSVECMNYKPVNKGSLLGFADLFVPKMGLEIYGCTLHQKDGRRWVNFPSREFTNDQGEKKYMSIVRFREKTHMNAFTELAKQAIETKCAEMNGLEGSFVEDEEVPF